MKKIESIITSELGVFDKAPDSLKRDDGIIINFYQVEESSKIKNNSLKIELVFDKTNLSKEESEEIGSKLIKEIILSLAISNNISFTYKYNTFSEWKNDADKRTSITKSFTMCSRICKKINVDVLKNFYIADNLFVVFDFFYNALAHNENGKKNEVAFWLYLSMEALAFECTKSEREIENEVVENGIIDRKTMNDLSYSLGRYYRHHKPLGKNNPIEIKKCLELVKNIIYFYNK